MSQATLPLAEDAEEELAVVRKILWAITMGDHDRRFGSAYWRVPRSRLSDEEGFLAGIRAEVRAQLAEERG